MDPATALADRIMAEIMGESEQTATETDRVELESSHESGELEPAPQHETDDMLSIDDMFLELIQDEERPDVEQELDLIELNEHRLNSVISEDIDSLNLGGTEVIAEEDDSDEETIEPKLTMHSVQDEAPCMKRSKSQRECSSCNTSQCLYRCLKDPEALSRTSVLQKGSALDALLDDASGIHLRSAQPTNPERIHNVGPS